MRILRGNTSNVCSQDRSLSLHLIWSAIRILFCCFVNNANRSLNGFSLLCCCIWERTSGSIVTAVLVCSNRYHQIFIQIFFSQSIILAGSTFDLCQSTICRTDRPLICQSGLCSLRCDLINIGSQNCAFLIQVISFLIRCIILDNRSASNGNRCRCGRWCV